MGNFNPETIKVGMWLITWGGCR